MKDRKKQPVTDQPETDPLMSESMAQGIAQEQQRRQINKKSDSPETKSTAGKIASKENEHEE